MRPLLIPSLLVVGLSACLPKNSDDDSGASGWSGWSGETSVSSPGSSGSPIEVTGTTSPTEDDDLQSDDVVLDLHSGGVSLTVLRSPSDGYDFGLAEDCGDPDTCWLAESCVTDTAGYAFCHDAGTTGVGLSLVASPDDVVSSSTTLFSSGLPSDQLGFMLDDGSRCWAWGDYRGYFVDALGCTPW